MSCSQPRLMDIEYNRILYHGWSWKTQPKLRPWWPCHSSNWWSTTNWIQLDPSGLICSSLQPLIVLPYSDSSVYRNWCCWPKVMLKSETQSVGARQYLKSLILKKKRVDQPTCNVSSKDGHWNWAGVRTQGLGVAGLPVLRWYISWHCLVALL